jgi:hypothetical protein
VKLIAALSSEVCIDIRYTQRLCIGYVGQTLIAVSFRYKESYIS